MQTAWTHLHITYSLLPAQDCESRTNHFASFRCKGWTEQFMSHICCTVYTPEERFSKLHCSFIVQAFFSQELKVACMILLHCLFSHQLMRNELYSEAVLHLFYVCASRWQHHSKLDCQSRHARRSHTKRQPHINTFTSGNKDACRCFHDSDLHYTASALHEKETDSKMARWYCSFVGDCLFFFFFSKCVPLCTVKESISSGWDRERELAAALLDLFS